MTRADGGLQGHVTWWYSALLGLAWKEAWPLEGGLSILNAALPFSTELPSVRGSGCQVGH